MSLELFNLDGKDYFTEKEAAHYACVSVAQFKKEITKYHIQPCWFMGKKLFRKSDIQSAIERQNDILVPQ